MRWTEAHQGVRMIKFLSVFGRYEAAELSQLEAAELLGMSERTFRRWSDRFEEDGEAGLLDRRLGKASGKRVPVDCGEEVEALYRSRYAGFTAKHFHEHLVKDHRFAWGYTWTKTFLQAPGLLVKAKRRGAHRRKRERRPLPGMMLHQDGSRHVWLEGLPALDLIVTTDDATSAIYSAFLVEVEDTASTFRGLSEVFGARSRPRTFSRGHLYWLLSNPVYAGDIRHKDQVVPGQHEAIIDRELWEAVQQKLKGHARQRSSATNHPSASLLASLLFDETGDRLCPSHAITDGRRYRYYISQRLMQERKMDPSGWRLPAQELEEGVMPALRSILEDQNRLHRLLNLRETGIEVMRTAADNSLRLGRILAGSSPEARSSLRALVGRIKIAAGEMRITFSPGGLHREFGIEAQAGQGEDRSPESSCAPVLMLPFGIRRRGVEARLIVGDLPQQPAKADAGLVDSISRARGWLLRLNTGDHPTIASLARYLGVDDGEISRILPLAFLAPDIVLAIVKGRQPVELTVRKLVRLKPVPAL